LLREAGDAGKAQPAVRIILERTAEIRAPTTAPFFVPVTLSAIIDIRKLCCFFGFSVSAGALGQYKKRPGDFDIMDLGLQSPSKNAFLGVMQGENVSIAQLEEAYVAVLTYGNKGLAACRT
jgi:hypothetical protein